MIAQPVAFNIASPVSLGGLSALRGAANAAVQTAMLFASQDNLYPNSNPSQSPVSHSDAQSRISYYPVRIDQALSRAGGYTYNRQATSNQDNGPGNSLTVVKASKQYSGAPGVVVPITWNGQRSVTLADDQGLTGYDDILPSAFGVDQFDAGEHFFYKVHETVPSKGGNFVARVLRSDHLLIDGQSTARMDLFDAGAATISDVDEAGMYSFLSGSGLTPENVALGGSFNFHGHFMLTGTPVNRKMPSTILLTDSIGEFWTKEIEEVAGNGIPGTRVSVPGMYAQSFAVQSKWLDLVDGVSDGYIALGTNDARGMMPNVIPGAVLQTATFLGYFTTIFSKMKTRNPDIKLHVQPLIAHTDSTDLYLTEANQTYTDANWNTLSDAFDAFLEDRLADGTIDSIVDVSPMLDPSDRHKWLTDGVITQKVTGDGYHTSSQSDASAGPGGHKTLVRDVYMPHMRAIALARFGADVPEVPQNVSLTLSGSNLVVAFEEPEYNGGATVSDYVIETSYNGAAWVTVADGVSTNLNHTLTSPTGTLSFYRARVSAVNSVGQGQASEPVQAVAHDVPSLPGLLAYWWAPETDSLTLNGTVVTAMADLSSNNRNLTPQVSTKGPITGFTVGPSALAALGFDDSDYKQLQNNSFGNQALVSYVALWEIDPNLEETGGMMLVGDGANTTITPDEGRLTGDIYSASYGTPTFYIDQVAQTFTSRDDVYTKLQSAGAHVFSAHSLDNSQFPGWFIGAGNSGASPATMRFVGMAVFDMSVATTADVEKAEVQFAFAAGL
jgi:hypothetical protein